jgi:uncharacterized membrane protein
VNWLGLYTLQGLYLFVHSKRTHMHHLHHVLTCLFTQKLKWHHLRDAASPPDHTTNKHQAGAQTTN